MYLTEQEGNREAILDFLCKKIILLLWKFEFILVTLNVYKEITSFLFKMFSVVMHIKVEIIQRARMEVSKVHMFYMMPLKLLLKVEWKLQSRTKPGVLQNAV